MIKIYLLDFSGADSDIISRSALPLYLGKEKNEILKNERIITYSLLSYAFYENFSRPLPPIERDENGRPFFPSENIDFNISHDKNLAALIISDEGKVGIDVQNTSSNVSERLIKKTEELSKKVLPLLHAWKEVEKEVPIKTLKTVIENETLCFKECNMHVAVRKEIDGKDSDLFSRWSFIEAVSKADGCGISGIEKLSRKNEKFLVRNGYLTDGCGRLYSFAVSKKI